MDVDIACVGFGPAMGGFLTTLSRKLLNDDGTPAIESATMPGMPLQVICYERADDIGFGVSGVVTRARGIRATFPDLDPAQIPMATAVSSEKLVYLLDPTGASRRSLALRTADRFLKTFRRFLPGRTRCARASLHAWLSAQEGRAGAFHRAVQSVGRFAVAVQRHGTNLAGNAGERSADRRWEGSWRAAARSGRGSERQSGSRLYSGNGHSRCTDGGWRWASRNG